MGVLQDSLMIEIFEELWSHNGLNGRGWAQSFEGETEEREMGL
jgi:hypothetical protein